MKEFMEEYGGVIVTCMLGIMLLGLLYSLLLQEVSCIGWQSCFLTG